MPKENLSTDPKKPNNQNKYALVQKEGDDFTCIKLLSGTPAIAASFFLTSNGNGLVAVSFVAATYTLDWPNVFTAQSYKLLCPGWKG